VSIAPISIRQPQWEVAALNQWIAQITAAVNTGTAVTFQNPEVVTIAAGSSTANTAFTPNGIFFLYSLNGIIQKPGIDYTLVGTLITMTVSANPGDQFLAWYTH
jgi:hypothetical protein